MQSTESTNELSPIMGISKIRILETLNQHGKLVLAHISRKTGLNYSTTVKALEHLCNNGYVREEKKGNQRVFEPTFREFHVQFRTGSGIDIILII